MFGEIRLLFRWPLLAIGAATVVCIGLACNEGNGGDDDIGIRLSSPTPTPVPASPTVGPSPTPTPTPSPGPEVCGRNPDPAAASVLQVQDPKPEEKVKSPIHVRGWGSEIGADNRGVVVALVDRDASVKTTVEAPPQPRTGRVAAPGIKVTDNTRPFGADLLVTGLEAETRYCIWVFLETTSAGAAKQIVQVPVTVEP